MITMQQQEFAGMQPITDHGSEPVARPMRDVLVPIVVIVFAIAMACLVAWVFAANYSIW